MTRTAPADPPLPRPGAAGPIPADPMAAARPADAATRAGRTAALAALAALVALCLAWELWLARTGSGTLAVKVLPLLPCVPGLLRHRLYTYRALSLLVWLYVLEGAVRAGSERGAAAALAAGEIVLSLLLFAACGLYVRHRLRNGARLRAAAAGPAP